MQPLKAWDDESTTSILRQCAGDIAELKSLLEAGYDVDAGQQPFAVRIILVSRISRIR